MRVTVADAAGWSDRLTGGDDPFDAVVLADVPRVSAAAAAWLHGFLRGGGGVWVVPGPGVDAAGYNDTLLTGPLVGVRLGAVRGGGGEGDGAAGGGGLAAVRRRPGGGDGGTRSSPRSAT